MRAAAALLGAAWLAGCAGEPVRLAEHVQVRVPAGASQPAPAVMLLSGCGGVRPLLDRYAETANQAGWAAIIVDSHEARGIGRMAARLQVCTGLRLRGRERAEDIFAALDLARGDARIDSERLVLAGWSHGGWTVLDAMAAVQAGTAPGEDPWRGVRGAFLVYPYCGALTQADTAPIGDPFAVTMLLVGKDRIADPAACRRLAERRGAQGSNIEIVFEPDLTHAFDDAEQPWDPRMAYDQDGARRNLERFDEFLTRAGE